MAHLRNDELKMLIEKEKDDSPGDLGSIHLIVAMVPLPGLPMVIIIKIILFARDKYLFRAHFQFPVKGK